MIRRDRLLRVCLGGFACVCEFMCSSVCGGRPLWVTGWVRYSLGWRGHHTGLPQYHHEFIKFSRTSRRPLQSNGTATTALIAPTYHAADFLAKPSLACGHGGAGKQSTLQNNVSLFLSSLVETDDGGRPESKHEKAANTQTAKPPEGRFPHVRPRRAAPRNCHRTPRNLLG